MVRVIRGETRMSPRGHWSSRGTVGDQMASRPVNPPGTGSSRRPARKPGGGHGCGADDRRGKYGLVAEHTGSDGAAAGIRGDRAAGGRGRQGLPPGQDDGESEEPGTAELCERARPGPPDREEAAGRRESDLRQSAADPGQPQESVAAPERRAGSTLAQYHRGPTPPHHTPEGGRKTRQRRPRIPNS